MRRPGASATALTMLVVLAACAPLPAGGQVRTLSGLRGPVTITRDARGVPHIRALASDLDVFFAQGYAHAQDRLWQMELFRRAGAGRLSEIFGSLALPNDRFYRTWGFARAARAALPALAPETRETLAAYAAGVNAFMAEGKLPFEFGLLGYEPEPWAVEDTLVWGKLLAYELGANWTEEVTNARLIARVGPAALDELLRPYPAGAPTVVRAEDRPPPAGAPGPAASPAGTLGPPALSAMQEVAALAGSIAQAGLGPAAGSNAWVLAGSRTESGKPILANDPHLRLSTPSLWYLVDLEGPTYKSAGASFPGAPGVVLGRNDRIAWGATNVAPDTQDLVVLDLEGESYRTPGGLVPLTSRDELIRVRGGPDVLQRVRSSRHGPILSDLRLTGRTAREAQAVAVRWTGHDPGDTTVEAILAVNRAKNWAGFRQAMRAYVGPMQAYLYADVDGNIGFLAPGRLPGRSWDGRLPARAALGQEWSAPTPFEQLPSVLNPREGLIASTNNKLLPNGAPGEPTTYTDPYRAIRLRELLLGRARHDLGSTLAIGLDTLSVPARELVPRLLRLTPRTAAARRLQQTLRGWDLRADLSSTGATAFAFVYRELARILYDETGIRYVDRPHWLIPTLRDEGRWCDDTRTPEREDCAAFQTRALELAGAEIEARLGPDPAGWTWGRTHRALFPAELGQAPVIGGLFSRSIPAPGSLSTLNVGYWNFDTLQMSFGATLRLAVDLADPDGMRAVSPPGQSGDPFSPLYDDQLQLWRDGGTISLGTRPEDWGKTSILRLQP